MLNLLIFENLDFITILKKALYAPAVRRQAWNISHSVTCSLVGVCSISFRAIVGQF